MRKSVFCPALLSIGFCTTALAGADDLDAIQAQVSGVLASADFVEATCPRMPIDRQRLERQIKRSGKSAKELRATEDYIDQQETIVAMVKQHGALTVCSLLPMAHGGYGRDIIGGGE